MLTMSKIPLEWADGQYWSTLVEVVSEQSKLFKKPQKKKVDNSMMNKFIKEG